MMRKRMPGNWRSRSRVSSSSVAPFASTARAWCVYESNGFGISTRIVRRPSMKPVPRRSACQAANAASAERRGFYRVDVRQVSRQALPRFALVPAAPDLAARRAEIQAERIEAVGGHRLALHGPPRLRRGEAAVLPPPCLAAV